MADNQKIADEIYNTVEATVQKAHVVDGLDVKSARALVDIADSVIMEVESLAQVNGLTGPDKKEIAADVISRLITINISWIPDFIETKAKKYIIESIIEFVVSWLNKKFGKTWLQ